MGSKYLLSSSECKPFDSEQNSDFPKNYDPITIERKYTDLWEDSDFYKTDSKIACSAHASKKFIMILPPPNVTGSLHLGHTLTCAIQDTLIRWHKMCGDCVVWVPGIDHAGIATQIVVERHLYKQEKKTRHDIGRDDFLKRVWEWKNKYGSQINNQLKRLGLLLDWSRETFTMSPHMSEAVTEAFITLYNQGLIYRETRLVSWCPFLRTALSDVEVEHMEIEKPTKIRVPSYDRPVEVGVLYFFKYPLAHSSIEFIEVATTRLETMLGDVAVAVHPEDVRYKSYVGKSIDHPFIVGRNLTVIADEYVDMNFGTGAVKLTPAHDPNDYELAIKHNLPFISIFTEDGKINENGGEFKGLSRFECRYTIEKRLSDLNLFTKKEEITTKMQLPICSRSNDIVEYMLLPQWWLNCQQVAKQILELLSNGELEIIPPLLLPTLIHWLRNIKNWCISRQLWWGHRIPAYKITFGETINLNNCQNGEVWIVANNFDEAINKAREKFGTHDFHIKQDEDVLDTWFSSSIFPFSVFGWPSNSIDLLNLFPITLLETGHDILFFWVVRMVIMSLLLLKRLPFKKIFLHAMVRDSQGRKMSKSLGNVIDPVEVIEGVSLENMEKKLLDGNLPEKEILRAKDSLKKNFPKGIPECGTDGLRFGLLAYVYHSLNINLDINRVVGYRYFCNKLWNAVKFSMMYFPNEFTPSFCLKFNQLSWVDKWILHRLSSCIDKVNNALKSFNFSEAVNASYNYWLNDFCNTFLEVKKPYLLLDNNDKKTSLDIMYICLDRGLRLIHPFMPFVTEVLHSKLPKNINHPKYLSQAVYPVKIIQWLDPRLDDEMMYIRQIVHHIRSFQSQLEIPTRTRLRGILIITTKQSDLKNKFKILFNSNQLLTIVTLSNLSSLELIDKDDNSVSDLNSSVKNKYVTSVVSSNFEVGLETLNELDKVSLLLKFKKKIEKNQTALNQCLTKIENMKTNDKVPDDIKKGLYKKLEELTTEKNLLCEIEKSLLTH